MIPNRQSGRHRLAGCQREPEHGPEPGARSQQEISPCRQSPKRFNPLPRRRGRPRTVQGAGPVPRRVRPQGNQPGRAGDARPHGAAHAVRRQAPARGRPHHGQPAHDDSDGRAHRDADRARRRRALGVLQHLLDAGSRGRGRCRRPSGDGRHGRESEGHAGVRMEGRDARGVLVVHEGSARCGPTARPDADRGRRRRRDAVRAQGARVRAGRHGPGVRRRRASPRSGASSSRRCARSSKARPGAWSTVAHRHPRRQRGDDDGRAPPLRDDGERHAALPRHQRQRLGDEEQVRQHLRLPALAARRSRARDRRDARRQGRRRDGLRRGRQGLRAGAARPGLPRRS